MSAAATEVNGRDVGFDCQAVVLKMVERILFQI
jgi:hypothetical protein